ncbi:acetate/propionate family kinase [Fibrella forsythiae]|uniref:Acetate kinase n=1 Tax=Fibrella forsythiae TaxID=2817061 RepID=A0ABS3JAZ4_9BACT|nr:acetate/propionate family kinase [Fibrella forsythiae]MBO0947156.1 acetate/propionate family kinase [Fibrella forsythiae]
MKLTTKSILTLNGGSSSIKFALYRAGGRLERTLHGQISRIGLPGTQLTYSHSINAQPLSCAIAGSDHQSAVIFLLDWLEKLPDFVSVVAIGHRVVHGMNHVAPERVSTDLLTELRRISVYDPDHLPAEIELIEACQRRHPTLPQIACFDTAFHQTLPRVAQLLPIPRRFDRQGIRRYGFHGLSYTYLIQELGRVAGEKAATGRVVLAHLGGGASLAAVLGGKSIDTTMGFTPAGGLPMGTRPGDLDPGVAWFMMQSEQLTSGQFNQLINHESGMLGISETSSDMLDLLHKQADDIRAAEAVDLFCYQTKKAIGGLMAILGGLDTLVFSGGIGEHASEIRSRICANLGYAGIVLNEKQNVDHAAVISASDSQVTVRVIATDEELLIAQTVWQQLAD